MQNKIDDLFSEIAIDRMKIEIKEWTLFKIALESFVGIESFCLSFENEGDDEGGSYKNFEVNKINDISVFFNPSYIDDYIGENDFFDESLQQLAFDKKIKQSDLEDEITTLAHIISNVSEYLLDSICDEPVNAQTIDNKIKLLEDSLKRNTKTTPNE